jgi:hypothetical protein
MKIKIIIYIFLFFLLSFNVLPQAGTNFSEFTKKLEPYFELDLINDIKSQLPAETNFSIWGWDVGDFSGDGFLDVAFTAKLFSDKGRIVHVYLFTDIDGFMTKVADFTYEYFELPLEIGIVIRDNACFITQKRKENDWSIVGYRFDSGVLILVDQYLVNRIKELTHESYRNFTTLQGTEKYILTKTGEEKFSSNYLIIPSYRRYRQIYKGYQRQAYTNYIEYVIKGAFYWTGDSDASFSVKSNYDDKYLYFDVQIIDDNVVQQRCPECPCDYIEIWMDVNYIPTNDERYIKYTDKEFSIRDEADAGIFSLNFYPGNFLEKPPYVKLINTNESLQVSQRKAIADIKAVAFLRNYGYQLQFRIPFTLFGYNKNPIASGEYFEFGCTFVMHDIDNEYRPEEETLIATSNFNPQIPSTFGSLILIPDNLWFGNVVNIYKNELLNNLLEFGF